MISYELLGIERDIYDNIIAYVLKEMQYGNIASVRANLVQDAIRKGEIAVRGLSVVQGNIVQTIKTHLNQGSYTKVKSNIPGVKIIRSIDISFDSNNISVITGKNLEDKVNTIQQYNYEERDFVKDIISYCLDSEPFKALLIHGIRRTGKTIAMWHSINCLISNGVNSNDILFLDLNYKCNLEQIINRINDSNAKYVFIDEATLITDLAIKGRYITDQICLKKKVVLTGTDSLMLRMCISDVMFGRTYNIWSNNMSFKEFKRLNRIYDKDTAVNEFMRFGGTTFKNSYNTDLDVNDQINTSILWNIKHTVQNSDASKYKTLVSLNDFTLLHTLYSYIMSITMPKSSTNINNIYIRLDENIKNFLTDKCDDNSTSDMAIPKGYRELVRALLSDIKVIQCIYNMTLEDNNIVQNTFCKWFGTMNCMNYSINSIIFKGNIPNEVIGELIENMILQQIYLAISKLDGYSLGYCRFNSNYDETPEIDAVISKRQNMLGTTEKCKYTLIEIKHSNKCYNKHYRNFKHTDIIKMYGEDATKIIVYRGDTIDRTYEDNGSIQTVHFVGLYDFMNDIEKWVTL